MIDVVWDMETGDPDDFLTLLLLCGHPDVNLKAVTITPGTPDQVGVVRWALKHFGLDIPVGSFNIEAYKQKDVPRVSKWHYNVYGNIEKSFDSGEGWEILRDTLNESTTLVTGGPLKNLGKLLRYLEAADESPRLGRLVVQGGFAGEGVVPEENQLEKFKGLTTCPTYNLNGDPKSAFRVLQSNLFDDKKFVSKNVCHGVYYDSEIHKLVRERYFSLMEGEPAHMSLNLIWFGMDKYLQKNKAGKKFHDPLAACCAIDNSIGEWAKVELFREKGKWGSRYSDSPNAEIIIGYDKDKFVSTLLRA